MQLILTKHYVPDAVLHPLHKLPLLIPNEIDVITIHPLKIREWRHREVERLV